MVNNVGAYSTDVRRLVFIKLQQTNFRIRETSRQIGVSPSTVSRWASTSNFFRIGITRKKIKKHPKHGVVTRFIQQFYSDDCNQHITPSILKSKIESELDVALSLSTIKRYMKEDCKLSRKRISNKVLGSCKPELVVEYQERRNALKCNEDTLYVSVDECHFSEKVIPLYGYSPLGKKCTLRNKKGSWIQQSLLSCIASDGTFAHNLKKGSINRVDFQKFINDIDFPKETVVIMDNCSAAFSRGRFAATFIKSVKMFSNKKASSHFFYLHTHQNFNRLNLPFQK